jgi:hypothetical protein
MRDNVVIDGIKEDENDTWQQTKEKLSGFFKDTLKIANPENIHIDRVHRFGGNRQGPRPIVAKIPTQESRDIVFSKAKVTLKNSTDYKVKEQLPPEITARRTKLWPKFLEAKKNIKNKVRWSLDKLFINGTCYTAYDDYADVNPACVNNDIEVRHTQHVTLDGSTFMGHCAPIETKSDTSSVMAKLLQDGAVASATHNIYAYRVKQQDKICEGQCDDGEHGAGHHILELLRAEDAENCMVVVSRWYGGQNLGPKRFTCIKDCAKSALEQFISD